MGWILGLIGLYLVVLVAVGYASVHPFRTPIFLSPGALGSPQESFELTNEAGKTLRAWWIPGEAGAPVVIFAHGYMMNRSEPSPIAHWLHSHGLQGFLFDFPGHGRSSRSRCGLGWTERNDIRRAIDWVRVQSPGSPIILWGSSMGAAASAFATAERPEDIHALILDSSYSRMLDAIDGWWSFLGGSFFRVFFAPLKWCGRLLVGFPPRIADVGEALAKIPQIPVLNLHGDADTLAAPDQAVRNQSFSAHPKSRLVWFPDCDHAMGRYEHPELYRTSVREFLEQNDLWPQTSETFTSSR